jgi:cell fate regulator YaaT (PSP1 superfamily)
MEPQAQAHPQQTRNFNVLQDVFPLVADHPSFNNPFGDGTRSSFSGMPGSIEQSHPSRNNSTASTLSASSTIWNDHPKISHRRTSSYQLGSPVEAVAESRSSRRESVSPPSSLSPTQPGFGNSPKQGAASRFFPPTQTDQFHNVHTQSFPQPPYSSGGQYLSTLAIPEDQAFAGVSSNNTMVSASGPMLSFPQASQVYGNCFYDGGHSGFSAQYSPSMRPYGTAPLNPPTGPRLAPQAMGFNSLMGPTDRRHSTGTSVVLGPSQPQARVSNVASERSPGHAVGRSVTAGHNQRQSTSLGISSTRELYSKIKPYFMSDPFGKTAFLNSAKITCNVDPQRAAGWISVSSSKLYIVLFKNFRAELFYVPEKCMTEYHVGDYVVVDADRGHDLGLVIKTNVTLEEAGLLKWRQQFESDTAMMDPHDIFATPYNANLSITTPKRIISMAQDNEVFQVFHKRKDEMAAVLICNEKIHEHKLEMTVMDCEYQWDRRKLTFFYSAKQRVDFRHLVSDIFKVYKTRIWMEAVHTEFPAFTRDDFIGYYTPVPPLGDGEFIGSEGVAYALVASEQSDYGSSDPRRVPSGVPVGPRACTQLHQRNASF